MSDVGGKQRPVDHGPVRRLDSVEAVFRGVGTVPRQTPGRQARAGEGIGFVGDGRRTPRKERGCVAQLARREHVRVGVVRAAHAPVGSAGAAGGAVGRQRAPVGGVVGRGLWDLVEGHIPGSFRGAVAPPARMI